MRNRIVFLFFAVLLFCTAEAQRTVIDLNNDWKFYLGDDSTAISKDHNDASWRTLSLPHDWSIEGAFSISNPATTQGGALPGGIGWYRKTFALSPKFRSKKVYVEFDGVYCNSEVWINGHYLGKRANGYISFRYDLSPYLDFNGGQNCIAVKVDNSHQPNSRWYSGSGIYRDVRLCITNDIAIGNNALFIRTELKKKDEAEIYINTRVTGTPGKMKHFSITHVIIDEAGKVVEEGNTATGSQPGFSGDHADHAYSVNLLQPHLWSVSDPYLYTLITKIYSQGKLVDEVSTPFGIRTINFDREKGFFLNGKKMKILGVCMHHDLGALGAAFNYRAAERQLQILKQMGCNAIRTSHNPPAPAFLDLCDKMGFLVMDEAFDMWKKKKNKFDYALDFEKAHEQDLADMIKRDRNHPSIFMWSIGNEIREQFDSSGIRLTKELTSIVKKYDPTRPVTSAITEMDSSKNFIYQTGALDILGINYNHALYTKLPELFPGNKFIASETMSAVATRGHYDMPSDSIRRWPAKGKKEVEHGNADLTVSAYDHVSAYWGSTHEETWKLVKQLDFISGLFVWTGFDYLGEPTPYPWPARSSYFGIVDLAGFPKDAYYMYQSEWTKKPVLHLFPHWNHQPGEMVDVWAYYNIADEVELYLNGKSMGKRKKQGDELHVMWRIPFEPGALKAISRKAGATILEKEIHTAGEPSRIELEADRKQIRSNGKDLCFITIRIKDADGNIVPNADNDIQIKIEGDGSLAGMDNGYQADTSSFRLDHKKAFNGLCLAVIRSGTRGGKIKITASSSGLKQLSCTVLSRK